MKLKTIGCLLGLRSFVLSLSAQQWSPISAPDQAWVSVASSADGAKLVSAASPYERGLIYLSINYEAGWAASSAPLINWIFVASSADGSKLVAAATECAVSPARFIPLSNS